MVRLMSEQVFKRANQRHGPLAHGRTADVPLLGAITVPEVAP